jgi:hypothetical protein
MLGRQWQMGEHQGEDASSPVRVDLRTRATPIEPVDGQSALDPRTVPAETIVESEPGDWWTAGRRIRLGRLIAEAAEANEVPLLSDPDLLLAGLPVPYDKLNGAGFGKAKVLGPAEAAPIAPSAVWRRLRDVPKGVISPHYEKFLAEIFIASTAMRSEGRIPAAGFPNLPQALQPPFGTICQICQTFPSLPTANTSCLPS